ncbi:MAG: 23S rRNA (pseudouridine(1915)-N(3))-methyltransferase RlmH [Alphaproteobacteria bacterium]|nr:23S rRNA (pseudouridine(1915)-N(3))-methyltransferase RlmH [Alphaproteobacteria bacterium]
MIKFQINAIGKLKKSPTFELIEDYKNRIHNQIKVNELEFKRSQNASEDSVKQAEAELLLSDVPKNSYLISMDETGDLLTSHEFAKFIEQKTNEGYSSFVFFIGGADGLHSSVKKRSNRMISLGKITLPHMLARLILVEQIYRIEKIMDNHPYDK